MTGLAACPTARGQPGPRRAARQAHAGRAARSSRRAAPRRACLVARSWTAAVACTGLGEGAGAGRGGSGRGRGCPRRCGGRGQAAQGADGIERRRLGPCRGRQVGGPRGAPDADGPVAPSPRGRTCRGKINHRGQENDGCVRGRQLCGPGGPRVLHQDGHSALRRLRYTGHVTLTRPVRMDVGRVRRAARRLAAACGRKTSSCLWAED